MKKLFSRYIGALLLACIFMYPSCKKIYHSTYVTPANYRLAGYTKITTPNMIAPPALMPVITENYSFSYDNSNRLSQVLYGTNDSNEYKAGLEDLRMNYTYSGDSIFKLVTNLKSTNIVELDTFTTNATGQLVTAEFTSGIWPTEYHSFTYAAALLDGETDVYSDTGTSISATSTFTSDNGDLLYQLFNGTLNATFPDSGISPYITPLFPNRDSILSYPLTVTWTQYLFGVPLPTVVTHNNAGSYTSPTDELNGYSQNEISVDAVDSSGVAVRTAYFPEGLSSSKFFQIYDFLTDRTGDYLQLQSFTKYGINIYQNAHMVKAMTTTFAKDSVSYVIDAQSKVTQTTVYTKDKYGNTNTVVYQLQYETY